MYHVCQVHYVGQKASVDCSGNIEIALQICIYNASLREKHSSAIFSEC